MVKFLIKYAKWIVAAVGILVFGLTQTEWLKTSEIWQTAEGVLINRRYTMRAVKPAHPDIKLVGVQNSTISLDQLWPEEIEASPTLQLMQKPQWDRRVYAAVLEKLMAAGAKVVVFDFVFARETEGDGVFAKALEKYKDRVVIGAKFESEEANGEIFYKYTPPNAALVLPGVEAAVGIVNLWVDPDGIERRGKYRTSIERETSRQPGGINPKVREMLKEMVAEGKVPDNLVHMSALAVEKFAGHVETPPYDHANFINFHGPAGTYDVIPLEKLFVDKLWESPPVSGGIVFSNKIVVVGPIAEIFHDTHNTPFGVMPGPEVQAQMMATLLYYGSLGEPAAKFNLALALCAVVFALVICLWIPQALLKVILLVATTVAFLVGCQMAFTKHDLVIPMMPFLFCLVATGSFGIVFQFVLEQFERLRTRNVLGRYVSENVAKTILEDQGSFEESLKGRKRPVTVLFSDIRGFTTLTENADAEKLVAQLNEYFLDMVGIVLQEGGTLSKYIGDAIMAVWGDTHSEGVDEDARRAVVTALQMRPMLAKLNERWKDNPDRQRMSIGIGVNHGEVIVGNIGHPKRVEFTVLGDDVNLASRLETATKQFRTDILIGGSVEALTRSRFVYRAVDLLTVQGKTKPVEVFLVLSESSQPPPPWLGTYHEAVKLYRARQFEQAAARFRAALQEAGGEDYLCGMYVGRCETYLKQPPPENWDGSYSLAEK